MRNELYSAKTPEERLASHKKIGRILQELPDGEYVVSIKRNKPIRSISQNKFYWALVSLCGKHAGHHREEIDYMFRMDRHYEFVEFPNGRTEKVPRRTSDLDTAEMTAVCNNLSEWIKDFFPEIIIPRREDLTYLQWMNIENEYNKTFSGY